MPKVTALDEGPGVNLANWISAVVMCLVVLTKASSSLLSTRRLTGDNIFILIAGTLAVGQTITVSEQVGFGLGQHQTSLDARQLEGFEKAGYAGELLYIVAIGFSRASSLSFLLQLAPQRSNHLVILSSIVFLAIWQATALLGIAFQCDLPHPWETLSDHCIDQAVFWGVIEIVDIILTILLAATPIFILWDLHVALNKKVSIMSAFGARILVVPLLVLRIIYTASTLSTADRTYWAYKLAIVTQVTLTLDLILCCVPFLKQFMDELDNGIFTSDLRFAPGSQAGGSQGDSYGLRSRGRSSNKQSKNSDHSSVVSRPWFRGSIAFTGGAAVAGGRQPSNVGSQERIIGPTQTFGMELDRIERQGV